MMRILAIAGALFWVAAAPVFSQTPPDKAPDAAVRVAQPQARPADVESPDAIIAALYDVISGPAGQRRDWDRFRSLFAVGARLIPTSRNPQTGEMGAVNLDPEGYITRTSARLEKDGFHEKEIARRTERFGGILHAFSTYESRRKSDDPAPFARGINSIQLRFDGKRWWIVTVLWQAESPESPLPAEYLRSANMK